MRWMATSTASRRRKEIESKAEKVLEDTADKLAEHFSKSALIKRYDLNPEEKSLVANIVRKEEVRELYFKSPNHLSFPYHHSISPDLHRDIYYFLPENIDKVLRQMAEVIIVKMRNDTLINSNDSRAVVRPLLRPHFTNDETGKIIHIKKVSEDLDDLFSSTLLLRSNTMDNGARHSIEEGVRLGLMRELQSTVPDEGVYYF